MMDLLSQYRRINVIRTYALGDIIMVIPIMRFLKKKFPNTELVFCLPPHFSNVFESEYDWGICHLGRGDTKECSLEEVSINFDFNTFELDHAVDHPFCKVHRTDILYELLGIPQEEREYRFAIGLRENMVKSVAMKLHHGLGLKPNTFAVFNWKGSNPIKTFPVHVRIQLVQELAKHLKVLIVDNNHDIEGRFEHPNVRWFLGNSIQEAICASGLAKFTVTTDSAPLWFSHIVAKPCVCFLGPTPEETRLNRHPLYGSNLVKKIELKDLVGCPDVCNHSLNWCKSQITCFSSTNIPKLSERMISTLKEMSLI